MSAVARWAPGLFALRHYKRADLPHDVLAGLVLSAFLVPVGVGYAQAAGLSPISGLYATISSLIVYALLGPSRVLVLGPDSSLAPVIAAVLAPLTSGDPSQGAALAALLAILTGIGIALAGMLRLGFLTELLSRPVQLGYLSGVGVLILLSQGPKILGVPITRGTVFTELHELGLALLREQWNGVSVALGAGTLGLLMASKRLAPRLPSSLIAVVLGLVVVEWFDLRSRIQVFSELPTGTAMLASPASVLSRVPELLSGAIGIALIAITDTSVLSRSIANQREEESRPDQELVALGAANIAAGVFAGFPISSSASRTPVAIAAGARTQLTGFVGALCVAALIALGPKLLSNLPQAVLSAIVVYAAVGFFDVRSVVRLYRARRTEAALWAVAFTGVVTIGVLQGILVAIVLSLGDFVRRAWRPHDAVLGRVDGLKGYHDLTRFPSARQIPGLLIYRFDAPLFFANAGTFRDSVRALARANAARWVVIAAEPITDIDTTAAEVLDATRAELEKRGTRLVFAELKDPTRDRLRRAGIFEKFGDDGFYPTLGTAITAYLKNHDVEWVDWDH